MAYELKVKKEIMCPLEYGIDIFGGKWKPRILCVLSTREVMRYNEIRKELCNITDAVLASMLKELIADGLIARKQYNEIPPKVEYTLNDKGKSILPILQSICQWSRMQTNDELDRKLISCKNCLTAST